VKKYYANKANLGSTWNSLSTIRRVKYWEIIPDNLKKAGWNWGPRLNRGLSRANDLDC